MPFAAIASAVSRTTFSLILSQANVFQLFQPIGGVRARPSHFWAKAGVARQRSRYSSSFFINSYQFLISSIVLLVFQIKFQYGRTNRKNTEPFVKFNGIVI